MKEAFLHYIWQYKQFKFTDLYTEQGECLQLIRTGDYTQQAGPDFFNGQIVLDGQLWAGNIEIHVKASDWYVHRHQQDENYDNVILHVVWEYDMPVLRQDHSEISVLVLSKYVEEQLLARYAQLSLQKKWIYCEDFIGQMEAFKRDKWLETLFFERLERKVLPIQQRALQTHSDWEAVFFCQIAQGFGLNINAGAFLQMAQSLPIKIIQKERQSTAHLEALFLGKTNILKANHQEHYGKDLWKTWRYLAQKYQLDVDDAIQVTYFKLHPDNFPTIRLSQLAGVLSRHASLFDAVLQCRSKEDYYRTFATTTTAYWKNHYVLDRESPEKNKRTTTAFVDLLIVNTVIPLTYAYHRSKGTDCSEQILDLISSIKPEKNNIINHFARLGVKVESSFDTQSLLQLKKRYCEAKKCLNCGVGRAYLYADKAAKKPN
ncbi:DUF2851 family protein [Flavobacterium sp. JP2137]|uniref:DUF2851 family protein n=1 Tax=Flavobacterium sp. JP2137 TaxID=3414510 RepID=UPI003D2FE8DC